MKTKYASLKEKYSIKTVHGNDTTTKLLHKPIELSMGTTEVQVEFGQLQKIDYNEHKLFFVII